MPEKSPHTIVLLHGLLCHGWIMAPLAKRLEALGFQTQNWSYASTSLTIAHHGAWLRNKLTRLAEDPSVERISIVGHSMGNIVTRSALAEGPPIPKLYRMVMLAPPNHGSYWADCLTWPLKWLMSTLPDLRTRRDSYVNQLPQDLPIPFGVLAGRFDELVPLWSTHLDSESDHIVVNALHMSMLFQVGPARQIAAFVGNGKFDRASAGAHNNVVSPRATT
jgi:pimeloyl-ACP methyl ester carboxylesterase